MSNEFNLAFPYGFDEWSCNICSTQYPNVCFLLCPTIFSTFSSNTSPLPPVSNHFITHCPSNSHSHRKTPHAMLQTCQNISLTAPEKKTLITSNIYIVSRTSSPNKMTRWISCLCMLFKLHKRQFQHCSLNICKTVKLRASLAHAFNTIIINLMLWLCFKHFSSISVQISSLNKGK